MMTTSQQKALLRLLDDEDAEVWESIQAKILEHGQDFLPLLLQEQQKENISPTSHAHISTLIGKIKKSTLYAQLSEWQASGGKDLLEGMRILASYENPTLTYDELHATIEEFYSKAWVELGASTNPTEKIKLLSATFFEGLGFRAVHSDRFYEVDVSRIDAVLESREGNPISLCVIYMLMAQKMGMPVYGVNLPNLFVLMYHTEDLSFYINVFNSGRLFTKREIDTYVSRLNLEPLPVYYEPCDHPSIIRRVCRNMILAYQEANEAEKAQDIQNLLLIWGEKA